jgi:transposase InsO family protein
MDPASSPYAWLHEPISCRAQGDARLLRLIRASFIANHGVYGSPRVCLDLREAGDTCNKHRVTRLMRVNKIRASRRGNCWDNAVAESFFSSLKKEHINLAAGHNGQPWQQSIVTFGFMSVGPVMVAAALLSLARLRNNTVVTP